MSKKKGKSNKLMILGILMPFLIIILIAGSFIAVIGGALDILVEVISNVVGTIGDTITNALSNFSDSVAMFFGIDIVDEGIDVKIVSEDIVQELLQKLENDQMNSSAMGITKTTVKKMLLATIATHSTEGTFCLAQTSEEEILENTEYTDIDDFLDEECEKKSSEDIENWIFPEVDLYYITDKLFYFEGKDQDGEDAWFLGVMGVISIDLDSESLGISDESEDISFQYGYATDCEKVKKQYENYNNSEKAKLKNKLDVVTHYTMEDGKMKLYKIIEDATDYSYSFKAGDISLEKEYTDDESTYEIETYYFDIESAVEELGGGLSLELLMNFLDISASTEYLDEFIDYALSATDIHFKGYFLLNETQDIQKTTYEINPNFVLEIYEMVGTYDSGNDNMKAYKELIFDRIYDGSAFGGSIVDIEDYEEINYKGVQYEDGEYDVDKIAHYLKTAYDPGTDFSLDTIEVEEVTVNRQFENDLQIKISNVNNWYGNLEYDTFNIVSYSNINGEPVDSQEYEEYDSDDLTMTNGTPSVSTVNNIYINMFRADEIDLPNPAPENIMVVETEDILDDTIRKDSKTFEYHTINGLAQISTNDLGSENDELGAGWGSDYIYAEYTKENIKVGNGRKEINMYLEANSSLPNVDMSKTRDFLSLWKNRTGTKDDTEYVSDGIKVEYDDIYGGKTKVGDLFENGADVLFQLLESTENTRGLVDVFKYIMHTYTGLDYGITDVSELENIIGTNLTYSSEATGGIVGGSIDGFQQFTVGGRTYVEFKQIDDRYRGYILAGCTSPEYDIHDYGCALVSVTIIAQGFGHDIDPIAMNMFYKQNYGNLNHLRAARDFTGLSCEWKSTNIKSGVIDQLKRGYPVIVHVGINNGRFSTDYGHYFTILAISEDESQIYVSDPASTRAERTGWLPISVLNDSAFDNYMWMGE